MDNSTVQIIGVALGQHGPYTFYKAFKYEKLGVKRIVKLGDFFFVKLWSDSDLVCICELLLLWYDKNSEQVLSSLRLYFLPENTPEGRIDHGEDEVLAISEKVILRLEDLVTWITLDAEWTWGVIAPFHSNVNDPNSDENDKTVTKLTDRALDFKDVDKEIEILMEEGEEDNTRCPSVIILSFPAYCRFRAIMKQIDGIENDYVKTTAARIHGGILATNKNTRVLFCRDTFDYPELEGHELLCNHLAPKLKGRPRGRRKKRSLSPGSESNESECSVSNLYNIAQARLTSEENSNGLCSTGMSTRRSTRLVTCNNESKEFLKQLIGFMQLNDTPMGRIPSLGYKELDLHAFFIRVDKLGGYESVTRNRLWKSIFDDLSGNYISTSAATVIRRHYERFLLPYELYLKGEEFHPSILKSTIKRTKTYSNSEADINDNTSCNTPSSTTLSNESTSTCSQLSIIPLPPSSDNITKDLQDKLKIETKPSSLRSVRVKPERLKDTSKIHLAEDIKSEFTVIKSESPPQLNIMPPSGLTVELITDSRSVKTEESAIQLSPPVSPSLPTPSISVTIAKPTEEKENIATCNSFINTHLTPKNTDVNQAEEPYSSKTPEPEIIHNSIIRTNCFSNSLLSSVKKRKLDILKEGGLEVTPVKHGAIEVKQVKENRPSVIHQSNGTKSTIGQLSITLTADKHKEKCKSMSVTNTYLYDNDQSPPKILQSSSIYSHSERTVYGNPKDYFIPPAPHTPRFINTTSIKPTGGDILDLTYKSPQKPVSEMMRLFNQLPRKIPKPGLDVSPRVGSNLEITLVAPTNKLSSSKHQNHLVSKQRLLHSNFGAQHQKQHQNGTKSPYSITPTPHAPRENRLSTSYNGRTTPNPQVTSNSYANASPSVMPNFYTQLQLANKMIPPYVPAMDPLYFQAMQSLYQPHSQPFLPIPSPEQIQFYTELMARNSQIPRFSFPHPQDNKNSIPIKSVSTESLKK